MQVYESLSKNQKLYKTRTHAHTRSDIMHAPIHTNIHTHPSPGKQDTKHLSTRMLVQQAQGGGELEYEKNKWGEKCKKNEKKNLMQ
jgi:hypothetical protein